MLPFFGMKKSLAREILQYKSLNGIKYMLVSWADGSVTWSRLSSLSCRDLVCDFAKRCLEKLKQRQQEEDKQHQKQSEAELLKKIISSSTSVNKNTEIAVLKDGIVRDIIKKSLEPQSPVGSPSPFIGIRPRLKQIIHTAVSAAPSFYMPKKDAPVPNVIYKAARKSNTFRLRYQSKTICELSFCYAEKTTNIAADVERLTLVPYEHVLPRLYAMHLRQDGSLGVFHADAGEQAPTTDFQKLEQHAKSENLFALHTADGVSWLLYFSDKKSGLFGLEAYKQLVVLRVENDPYLCWLPRARGVQRESTDWAGGRYEAGLLFLSDCLFAGQSFPAAGPCAFIGDRGACAAKHIVRTIKKVSSLLPDIKDGCNVIIQDTHLDYIHQADNIDLMALKSSKIFSVEKFRITEVLRPGGIFTITEKYMESCELMPLFEFVVRLVRRSNWGIKIAPGVYRVMKMRVAKIYYEQADKPMIARAYNALKANCLEQKEADFRRQLEKTFWKGFRLFLVIDAQQTSKNTITLDTANRIIGPE